MSIIVFLLFFALVFVIGWHLGSSSLRQQWEIQLAALKDELRREFRSSGVETKVGPIEVLTTQSTLGSAANRGTAGEDGSAGTLVTEDELIAILSATVAAYLGKQVRVRQARLLDSPLNANSAWAQAGRVTIQGSHALGRR